MFRNKFTTGRNNKKLQKSAVTFSVWDANFGPEIRKTKIESGILPNKQITGFKIGMCPSIIVLLSNMFNFCNLTFDLRQSDITFPLFNPSFFPKREYEIFIFLVILKGHLTSDLNQTQNIMMDNNFSFSRCLLFVQWNSIVLLIHYINLYGKRFATLHHYP